MEKDINAWAAKRWLQSARAHAKRAGCIMSAGDAKCADARETRGPQLRGEVSGSHCPPPPPPPPHLPFNAHAMQPRFHSRGPRWAAIARHVKALVTALVLYFSHYCVDNFCIYSNINLQNGSNQLWIWITVYNTNHDYNAFDSDICTIHVQASQTGLQ